MCDCAEEAERRRKLQLQKENNIKEPDIHATIAAGSPPPNKYSKKLILALTALLCGLVAVLFSSLDQKTKRRILTMLGLGWLITDKSRPYCGPHCPTLSETKRKWPVDCESKPTVSSKECCTCDDN